MALERVEESRVVASAALVACEARRSGVTAVDVIRTLALAEGKLGEPRGAERLEALIAQQNALGATGLRLGLSYEARAQLAIWSGDSAAFERFSELTAREYRHGARTALGARYERLMNEAARAGMQAKLTLADFQALAVTVSGSADSGELLTVVTRTMEGCRSLEARAQFALQLICTAWASQAGHLYLLEPARLALRASYGESTPSARLSETVAAYVAEQQRNLDELDGMATEAVASDAKPSGTVQVDGRCYELLALNCVVDGSSVLAGVAALESVPVRDLDARHAQILPILAARLLSAG